jgi:hypothetical protein
VSIKLSGKSNHGGFTEMGLQTLDKVKQGFTASVFGFRIHLWSESEVSFHTCSCGIQYKIIVDSEGEVSRPSCVVCGVEFEIRGTPLEIYSMIGDLNGSTRCEQLNVSLQQSANQ